MYRFLYDIREYAKRNGVYTDIDLKFRYKFYGRDSLMEILFIELFN